MEHISTILDRVMAEIKEKDEQQYEGPRVMEAIRPKEGSMGHCSKHGHFNEDCWPCWGEERDQLRAENARLREAYHLAILKPKGIIPANTSDLYDQEHAHKLLAALEGE